MVSIKTLEGPGLDIACVFFVMVDLEIAVCLCQQFFFRSYFCPHIPGSEQNTLCGWIAPARIPAAIPPPYALRTTSAPRTVPGGIVARTCPSGERASTASFAELIVPGMVDLEIAVSVSEFFLPELLL